MALLEILHERSALLSVPWPWLDPKYTPNSALDRAHQLLLHTGNSALKRPLGSHLGFSLIHEQLKLTLITSALTQLVHPNLSS